MTQGERTQQDTDARIDAELGALPLEIEPARDLWPDIEARIAVPAAPAGPARRGRPSWMWQAAAGLVLVAGSSLLTASLLDRSRPDGQAANPATASQPAATPNITVAMPVTFGPSGRLDPEYAAARKQLTQMLDQRIAALPLSARAKLEFNLGEMRRAADEINAALAEQPGDPLLEELLLKTYQDELAVLASVGQLTGSLDTAAASPPEKRMQL